MAVNEVNCMEGEFDYEWDVYSLCYKPKSTFGIVLLNTGLSKYCDKKHFIDLWTGAALRICVDGGANDFYNYVYMDKENKSSHLENSVLPNSESSSIVPIPDIISGDLDSIKPAILEYFRNLGTKIIHTPNQNETDFTKSLILLKNYNSENDIKVKHVLAVVGTSCSRFDHVLAQVNTIYKIHTVMPCPVIAICGSSLYWVLSEGYHKITVPPSVLPDKQISWCGYASLNEPVITSTSGLKFDVANKKVMLGESISTSNTYCQDSKGIVHVKCSKPLLWFMGWDQM